MEGYLVCLDANTGKLVWETQVADPSHGYSLSMAPLIVNRSVVVGVAGAEYAIRGFLAAYDPETGKKQWQFETIPGPEEPATPIDPDPGPNLRIRTPASDRRE